jgi:hypothetical protein
MRDGRADGPKDETSQLQVRPGEWNATDGEPKRGRKVTQGEPPMLHRNIHEKTENKRCLEMA